MLENCKSALERWGGVNDIIDRWLKERKEMLVTFCALSDAGVSAEEQGKTLETLCQIMVDYVSAGHFEIYDQLIKEGRDFNNENGLQAAGKLYRVIDGTTEQLLDFNDKYQATDDLTSLANDLSLLGEQLETRFEAEDQMIQVLHTAHKNMVV